MRCPGKKIAPAICREMNWLDACKEYAKQTGKWVVPKKDSEEYNAIRKLMGSAEAPAPESKPTTEPFKTEKRVVVKPKKEKSVIEAVMPPSDPVEKAAKRKAAKVEVAKQAATEAFVAKKTKAARQAKQAEEAVAQQLQQKAVPAPVGNSVPAKKKRTAVHTAGETVVSFS